MQNVQFQYAPTQSMLRLLTGAAIAIAVSCAVGCSAQPAPRSGDAPLADGNAAPGYLYTLAQVQEMGRVAARDRHQAANELAKAKEERIAAERERLALADERKQWEEAHKNEGHELSGTITGSAPQAPAGSALVPDSSRIPTAPSPVSASETSAPLTPRDP